MSFLIVCCPIQVSLARVHLCFPMFECVGRNYEESRRYPLSHMLSKVHPVKHCEDTGMDTDHVSRTGLL